MKDYYQCAACCRWLGGLGSHAEDCPVLTSKHAADARAAREFEVRAPERERAARAEEERLRAEHVAWKRNVEERRIALADLEARRAKHGA